MPVVLLKRRSGQTGSPSSGEAMAREAEENEAEEQALVNQDTTFRKVNYELRDFQLNSISGRAVYVGRGPAAFTREIALVNDGTLASAEGLSGAPVFQVNNDENGLSSTEAFAGVLIRGNSSRALFLEHRQIIGVLIQICGGNYQSAGSSNPQAEPP
jgi:hypothetical protein